MIFDLFATQFNKFLKEKSEKHDTKSKIFNFYDVFLRTNSGFTYFYDSNVIMLSVAAFRF